MGVGCEGWRLSVSGSVTGGGCLEEDMGRRV